MKIIKKKRGFTTNSSGTADWFEPAPGFTPTPTGDATNAAQSSGATNRASSNAWVATPPRPERPSQQEMTRGNIGVIAALICTVAGLFALDRLVRATIRRRHKKE